jgi:DNA-binding response OmpR family regulator
MSEGIKNILVVDDEHNIVEFVESYLVASGYKVYKAYNGEDALSVFKKEDLSLILLDLMLPDIKGEDVCKTIRKTSKIPIIMLTAKVEEENILKGLDIGADDYVTKPFSPRQLVARVGALLRRVDGKSYSVSSLLTFNDNDLTIDTITFEVIKSGEVVNLTPFEYKILYTLAKSPSRVFSRGDLIDYSLGEDFKGFDRAIDSHVKNLRQKIETDTKNCEYVLTAHGLGYKFGGK